MNQASITKLRLCFGSFLWSNEKKRIEKVSIFFLGLFRYIQTQNPSLDFHHFTKHLCAKIDLVALIVIIVRYGWLCNKNRWNYYFLCYLIKATFYLILANTRINKWHHFLRNRLLTNSKIGSTIKITVKKELLVKRLNETYSVISVPSAVLFS